MGCVWWWWWGGGEKETCWLDVAPNTCGCELGDYEQIDEMCLAVDAGRKLTSGQSEDGVDQMGIRGEGGDGGGVKNVK